VIGFPVLDIFLSDWYHYQCMGHISVATLWKLVHGDHNRSSSSSSVSVFIKSSQRHFRRQGP